MIRYQLGTSCHFGISLKYLSPPHPALNNSCASCCILWLQSFKHSCWTVPFCGSDPLQVMHAFHSSLEWRTHGLLNTARWFLQTTLLHPPQPPDYLSVITNFLFPDSWPDCRWQNLHMKPLGMVPISTGLHTVLCATCLSFLLPVFHTAASYFPKDQNWYYPLLDNSGRLPVFYRIKSKLLSMTFKVHHRLK